MMDGGAPVGRIDGVSAASSARGGRRLVLALVGCLVLAVGGWFGWQWWSVGRFLETTDDAYVASDMAPVSSRIAGQVETVLAVDNQRVRAGDVLVRLDARDLVVALDQARADVAGVEADLRALQAQLTLQESTIGAAAADVASADATLVLARAEYARYTDLVRTGNGSVQRAQQAEAEIRGREAGAARARAALEGARQQSEVLRAQVARSEASLARARAVVRQAELNLSYGTIVAPVDGAVGDRTARPGQYVQAGTRLMSVVPMEGQLYVVANFKETQLARLGAGERVEISVDMLPDQMFAAQVDSLAPGSGSMFALLPPENATGNFTKIVQRVPVRLRLEPHPALGQLRPGLSVKATVDTRTAPAGPLRTDARVELGAAGRAP